MAAQKSRKFKYQLSIKQRHILQVGIKRSIIKMNKNITYTSTDINLFIRLKTDLVRSLLTYLYATIRLFFGEHVMGFNLEMLVKL